MTHWDNLGAHQQADVLAYDQIRRHDADAWDAKLVGAGTPKAARKGKR